MDTSELSQVAGQEFSSSPPPSRGAAKWVKIGVVLLFLAFAAFVLAGAGLIYMVGRQHTSAETVLLVKVSGDIPERRSLSPLAALFEPPTRTLLEYDLLLERAAEDPRVAACKLEIGSLGSNTGWAKVLELRNALAKFREKGNKPVVACLEFAGNKELYLASVADQTFLAPEGFMSIGLMGQGLFIKDLLGKLRVKAQFEHRGKYKGAAEMFTRREMSEPVRESIEALLGSINDEYMLSVASSRNLAATRFQDTLDRSFISAEDARRAGLVNDLVYYDEVEEYLKTELGIEDEIKYVSTGAYWKKRQREFSGPAKHRIALIYALGPIFSGETEDGIFGEQEGIGSDTLSKYLREVRKDEDIEAVVLRVDSPGGSGLASDVIWREVSLTRDEKPVIVSMSDYAASGGYYISMAADHIVAQPNTITGSIGVIAGKLNMGGLFDWIGVNFDTIKLSENADMFSSTQGFSDEQREILCGFLDSFYLNFVSKAAQGRKRKLEELEEVAQGRVWSGTHALTHGLVDELGGLRDALDIAKERAGIAEEEKVSLVMYPKPMGFFEALRSFEETRFEAQLPETIRAVLRQQRMFERFSGELVLAILPGILEVR